MMIGQYIETFITWLTEHFAPFFDALSYGIGGFIEGFQQLLYGIPILYNHCAAGCLVVVQGRQMDGFVYRAGVTTYLWYGFLVRNDANAGFGVVFHRHRFTASAFRLVSGRHEAQDAIK